MLCSQIAKVSYYKIKNSGGPAKPRNYGIKKAIGDYLAFVDDDDIWLPTKIEQQVLILEENLDFDLVHSFCEVIDFKGIRTGEKIGRPGSPLVKHGNVKLKMSGNWTLMMPTPMIRKSLIHSVGLFNEEIPAALEDVEFWTRCSFYTKFYYIDKALANYRIHNNNISSKNKDYIQLPLYLKRVLDLQLKENNVYREEYKKIKLNICLSQAKHINNNVLKTIVNLFKLNPFWIINFRIIGMLIKRIKK